jgi:hypothetical protein
LVIHFDSTAWNVLGNYFLLARNEIYEDHGYRFGRITNINNDTMKTSLIFLLGIGMGTVLGILVAPEAGRVTRRKIREEADRFIDEALAKRDKKNLEKLLEPTNENVNVLVTEERYTI